MDFPAAFRRLAEVDTIAKVGRVHAVVGPSIRAMIPEARVGEVVRIERRRGAPLEAQIVGFEGHQATLLPLGSPHGIGPDDAVFPTGEPLMISCSPRLLGRVLDGRGDPVDSVEPITGDRWAVDRSPPPALGRPRLRTPMITGLRAIDGMLTLARGQRVGLFAGSGVGKSTLLGRIARETEADVFVVCLIGERGRELTEFIEDFLGPEGLRRGVVVCATSDAPALLRMKAAHVATAIAEWFRDQGQHVVLLVDSLTRFARAAREVGLAAGEAPARRGFPPSAFAALPQLVERAGLVQSGSITGIYTVLVEGSDLDEPVADELRGVLDGHITLSRTLAEQNHFPAIDILKSLSRSMPHVVATEHQSWAASVRQDLATYEQHRDLIRVGAYRRGSDPRLDRAVQRIDAIENYLKQPAAPSTLDDTLASLRELAVGTNSGKNHT